MEQCDSGWQLSLSERIIIITLRNKKVPILSLFKGRPQCLWQLSWLFQRVLCSAGQGPVAAISGHLLPWGSNHRPTPSLGSQHLPSGFPLLSHVHWDAGGAEGLGTAFPSSSGAPVPVVEGENPSCECSLAARGWHIVYTRVCELSQTSQTRIRAELGRNQCSNIATQGLPRVTQAKERGRTGVTAPVAFTSPYLGFSAVKLVLATGPNLDFRQQNSLSQAALLLCRAGALPCPAWQCVQCHANLSPLAEPPPFPHLHCCLCCCYRNSQA